MKTLEALIEEARGPEGADPFKEPMFLARFAALVRAAALDEAAAVCVEYGAAWADTGERIILALKDKPDAAIAASASEAELSNPR